ncbi:MAG TPA: translocation/assembly module TamB domain-containing protein [Kofleriaceae bacterium]
MGPGLRKLLRWLGRIGLGVLALVLVVLAVTLIVVHTDRGRELIRARVELVLRGVMPGGVRIGKLEGSPFGTLTIRDLELDATTRRPFVKAGTVRVEAAIWPLVRKIVHVESIVIEDVQLDPMAGPLLPPRPDNQPPLAWRLELPHIELHRAAVELGAAELAVRELELAAAVTIADPDITAYAWLDTRWGNQRVAASLTAAIDRTGVHVPAALVMLDAAGGRARIAVSDLLVDTRRPRGHVLVSAPAPVVGVWFPEATQVAALGAPLGDVVVAVDVEDEAKPGADVTHVALTGYAGPSLGGSGMTKLAASLHGSIAKLAAHGVLQLSGLELAPLTRGTLRGPGAVVAGVEVSLDHARAELAVLPALVARSEPQLLAALDRAAKALAASESTAAIATELAGAGAPAGPRVLATAEVIHHGATWQLVAARAAGTVSGAVAAGQPVRGRVAFRVQAVAPRDPAPLPAHPPGFTVDADVDGGVELRSGGFAGLAVSAAYAQFRGGITGRSLRVNAEAAADGIARDGRPLGDVQLRAAYRTGRPIAVELSARPAAVPITAELSASVALGDVIRVELARLALQLPGDTRWDGGGGVLTIGDRIALRGLALHHRAATLELAAQLDPARGDLVADVNASHVELATLNRNLRGEGSSAIHVERRGHRWQADAKLDVLGLAAGKTTPPTDASVHLALADGQLTIDARANGGDRQLDRAAAWLKLDAGAIHKIRVTAHQLQLGGLVQRATSPADLAALDDAAAAPVAHSHSAGPVPVAPEAPEPAPVAGASDAADTADAIRGTIDGELDLAPTHPSGSLALRGIGLPIGVLDADVALAAHHGALAIKLDARMPDVAVAHVAAELDVPAHLFDPATWRKGALGLVRQVDLALDKVRVNAALLDKLGLAQKLAARGTVIPYRASIAAKAHVGAGVSDAVVNLDLTGIRGGPLAQSLAEHLEVTASATGTVVHGELRGGGTKKGEEGKVPLGTLDATLAMTMAQWLAAPRTVLGAALSARWVLPDTDAVPILAIVDRHELTGGTLAIDAAVTGTPGAPILDHADVIARKLAARAQLGGHAPPVFDELRVSAKMAAGAAGVTVTGRELGGGTLDAELAVPLPAADLVAAAHGTLGAHRLDLAPIAAVLPGRFSAVAGTLDGALAFTGGKLSGALAVTGGALPIAPVIGTLHDTSAKLAIDDKHVHVELTGGLGGGAIEVVADAPPDLATATAKLTLTKVALLGSHRTEISAEVGAKLKLAGGEVTGELDVKRGRINVAPRTGVPLLEVDVPDDLVLPTVKTRTSIAAATAPAAVVPAPGLVAGEQPAEAAATEAATRSSPVNLHVALGNTILNAPDVVAVLPGVEVASVHAIAHSDAGLDVAIGEQVAIVGRIDLDSGDVDFLGRRYLITADTSSVTFDGSVDPLLAIQMSYAFPSMTLTADVRGRVSTPDPHLSSDTAGYSDDQLFAFFLGGSPTDDVQQRQADSSSDAATVALAKVASGALGRQFNKILPVKLYSVACAPGTAAASKSCTLGKQLSRRLYLYYSTRPTPLTNENTNEVQLQYRLSNTTLIDVTGGDREHHSADLLSRHPW